MNGEKSKSRPGGALMPFVPAPALAALLLLLLAPPAARAGEVRLSATLFGETVGEVHLRTTVSGTQTTLSYRSELRVVRQSVRLRQRADAETTFETVSGALVRSTSRRCAGPEDAPSECTSPRLMDAKEALGAAPALAAELLLARGAPGVARCLAVVDEASGQRGEACAVPAAAPGGVELAGTKLGEPFRALVRGGRLVRLELPGQGALFAEADGPVDVSDEDLFADPIPSSGDAAAALRRGRLRVRVHAPPSAMEGLRAVDVPWQRVLEEEGRTLVEVDRVRLPKGAGARRALDHAALLLAQARGTHVDCQAATGWFLKKARARGWQVRPAVGFAWVDGRFAFHSWAVVETPQGPVPVDPLLAQVPADAGHVELARSEASAGALLVAFRRGLSLEVAD